MNAELPSFKNGKHNSESASTIDRAITPLMLIAHNRINLFLNVHNESQNRPKYK